MDDREWFKNVPSSDLLLHELVMRGLPDSAKQVFRDCRLVKPLYFVDGVVFSEPQLLAANQFGTERYFILGRFADYSTFLMDCKTGKLGQGKAWVYDEEDYDFQDIPEYPTFLDRELLTKFGAYSRRPEEVFDMSISATLEILGIKDDDSVPDAQQFQRWIRERHVPETVWPSFSALRYSCEVSAGGGGWLFKPDYLMKFNDAFDGLVDQGFLAIGSRPGDVETIVIDFRGASPVVGLMALEEADDCVYERHCMTVSPSFERYFHDSVCLENMPDSFYDARDFKTDLSWV